MALERGHVGAVARPTGRRVRAAACAPRRGHGEGGEQGGQERLHPHARLDARPGRKVPAVGSGRAGLRRRHRRGRGRGVCDRPPALVHDRPRRARRRRRRRRRGRVEGQHRHRDVRRRLPARLARGRARHAVEPGLGGALRDARHALPADRRAGGRPDGRGRARARAAAERRPRQRLRGRDRHRRGGPRDRADARADRPGGAPRPGRRDRRSAAPHDRLRRAGRPKRRRGAPRHAGHRPPDGRRAHHTCRDAAGRARRRIRRERRRDRGRHDLAARRRRAVLDLAAAGPVLAPRPRGRLAVPRHRGRRPDRREPRRLLRADDARVAPPRADGARRNRPRRPGRRRGVAGRDLRRGPAARAGARPPMGDQDVRRQPAGVRARLPDRRRPQPPEPCARRRHPLDRRVVVASARRARARGPGRGRSARAGRAAGARRPPSSPCRGSSATQTRRRSSPATPATARSSARASR